MFNFAMLATVFGLGGKPAGPVPAPVAVAPPVPLTPMFDFAIAGGRYHGLEAALPRLVGGVRLQLRREPENRYDANAIAVILDGIRLGYIPRRVNRRLAALLDLGAEVHADVVGKVEIRERGAGRLGFAHTGYAADDPLVRVTVVGDPDSLDPPASTG